MADANLTYETLQAAPEHFSQVILALVLGIASGLFFGESTAGLEVLGDAYVRLLLMTVLPYVVAALVRGIGRLNPA